MKSLHFLKHTFIKSRKGTTLIETVVAVGIFAAAFLALALGIMNLQEVQRKSSLTSLAINEVSNVLEQVMAMDFDQLLVLYPAGQNNIVAPATPNAMGSIVLTTTLVEPDRDCVDCLACYREKGIAEEVALSEEYVTCLEARRCPNVGLQSALELPEDEDDGGGTPEDEQGEDEDGDTDGPGSGGGGGCFLPGTLIAMADGSAKPIQDIRVGEEILSYDFELGKNVPAQVYQTFVHPKNPGGYLVIDGLKVTPNHPLWINGTWKEAGAVRTGDHVATPDGTLKPVENIVRVPGIHAVYNFEIESTHVYYAKDVLGHNYISMHGKEEALPDERPGIVVTNTEGDGA